MSAHAWVDIQNNLIINFFLRVIEKKKKDNDEIKKKKYISCVYV